MSERHEDALDYVESHHVMTLATSGPLGPWAAAVFYANDGFTLTFLSSQNTRHAGNLESDARCAAAIHEDYTEWTQIKGIQIEGNVHILSGANRARAIARYAEKFPLLKPGNAPALIRTALKRVAWYELVPERCFFIDNAAGFAHRDEIPLP